MISHFTRGVLGAMWRSIFALMSAATAPLVVGALLQQVHQHIRHGHAGLLL